MPTLDSYIFFNGDCADAMRFYHQVLGGELEPMLKYGDAPESMPCPAGSGDRIMHACLALDGRMLMASDAPAGEEGARGGFAVALQYPQAAQAQRAFDALAAGGTVTMPMQKTFWTDMFGMLTDRFGTPWMVGGGAVPR